VIIEQSKKTENKVGWGLVEGWRIKLNMFVEFLFGFSKQLQPPNMGKTTLPRSFISFNYTSINHFLHTILYFRNWVRDVEMLPRTIRMSYSLLNRVIFFNNYHHILVMSVGRRYLKI